MFREVVDHPVLPEIFDLRTCRVQRSKKFQDLVQDGSLLSGDDIENSTAFPKHFLQAGAPCVTKYSVYWPSICRVYPMRNDRLPFHVVSSINRLTLDQLEIVAYPRLEDLDTFRNASVKTTKLYGPGDDHPGSIGVLAFSLQEGESKLNYLQASVNYKSNLLENLIPPKLARKYAGWQAAVINHMVELSAEFGAQSVVISTMAKLSEVAAKILKAECLGRGWKDPLSSIGDNNIPANGSEIEPPEKKLQNLLPFEPPVLVQ